VPWPRVVLRRLKHGGPAEIRSYSVLPIGRKQPPEPSVEWEAETYIPVSALLSGDVARAFRDALPAEVIEAEITLPEIARAMQAAIDHLGGTDAH
jgi:hypothetical protein